MIVREFKQIMKNKGFNVKIGYGQGYTLIKGLDKYFIRTYDIICLSDISYLNLEDFKFYGQ